MLVANVEEARFEALASEDGKMLVRARYAVRNNQRAFLALKLPAQSVLWSAVLAGRPVRPGLSADGAYLLPLLKGRPGETAPTFAVELVYLERTTAWTDEGRGARRAAGGRSCRSRARGLLVHHSPRFAGAATSRARSAPKREQEPWSAALREPRPGAVASRGGPAPPPPVATACAAQPLRREDRARPASAKAAGRSVPQEMGRTTAGVVPVEVTVPAIGPSFFVVAELTAERTRRRSNSTTSETGR